MFIDRIARKADRIAVLEYVTDEAAEGRIEIATSTLTLAEVLYCKSEDGTRLPSDIEMIRRFFDQPFIHVKQVTRKIAEEAAVIARSHGIKPPDAIHVATAIDLKCAAMHTYDGCRKDRKDKRKRLLEFDKKIGTPALSIVQPSFQVQTPLFDRADSRGREHAVRSDLVAFQPLAQPCPPTIHGRWNVRRPGALTDGLPRVGSHSVAALLRPFRR